MTQRSVAPFGAANEKPTAPAVARNRDAILEVLSTEFRDCRRILEIGSGTGEHAIFFAPSLSWLTWQTSDRAINLSAISAWLEDSDAPNLIAPIELDVSTAPAPGRQFDGVFSANTAHIMSESEVQQMFRIVGDCLTAAGRFCLYGPFNVDGQFTSESNAAFDASLRAGNEHMGIRDLELLDRFAAQAGMTRATLYGMPANNFVAVWMSGDDGDDG